MKLAFIMPGGSPFIAFAGLFSRFVAALFPLIRRPADSASRMSLVCRRKPQERLSPEGSSEGFAPVRAVAPSVVEPGSSSTRFVEPD